MKKITLNLTRASAQDVYCAIEDYLDWVKTWLVDRRVLRKSDIKRNKKKIILTHDEKKMLSTYKRLVLVNKKVECVWEEDL